MKTGTPRPIDGKMIFDADSTEIKPWRRTSKRVSKMNDPDGTLYETGLGIVPEMSFAEIGQEMGISRSAATRLFYQALAKLWWQFRFEESIVAHIPEGWKKMVFVNGKRADRYGKTG